MYQEMRLAGLADPMYQQTQGSVRLVLSGEPVDRELERRLPPETRAIVAALRDGSRLSTGEVADLLGVSRVTASQRLRTLQDAGLIVWRGKSAKDPRAWWELPPA
jgi:ATP-dependent DNA helicase RecG